MTCKLCQQDSTLRNSHIIPEWCYEGVYDAKHRFVKLEQNFSKKPEQKGFREYLLCQTCETHLSRMENRLKSAFDEFEANHAQAVSAQGQLGNAIPVTLSAIDYTAVKNGLLSILWRMSITNLAFFQSYQLGVHEESLRQQILANSAISFEKWPIMITLLTDDQQEHMHFISLYHAPGHFQNQYPLWSFIVYGFLIDIIIGENVLKPNHRPDVLQGGNGFNLHLKDAKHIQISSDIYHVFDNPALKKFYGLD